MKTLIYKAANTYMVMYSVYQMYKWVTCMSDICFKINTFFAVTTLLIRIIIVKYTLKEIMHLTNISQKVTLTEKCNNLPRPPLQYTSSSVIKVPRRNNYIHMSPQSQLFDIYHPEFSSLSFEFNKLIKTQRSLKRITPSECCPFRCSVPACNYILREQTTHNGPRTTNHGPGKNVSIREFIAMTASHSHCCFTPHSSPQSTLRPTPV